jgi:hypothetical protein
MTITDRASRITDHGSRITHWWPPEEAGGGGYAGAAEVSKGGTLPCHSRFGSDMTVPATRACRKCGANIPNWATIDGRARNLRSRKFCLDCSPFGGRNTKPDDPARSAARALRDGQRAPFSAWTDEARERHRAWLYHRRRRRQEQLIALSGGQCIRCGYDRCSRALSFHHREPGQKEFSLNSREILTQPWERVLAEAAKCELVCLNCHMEIEAERYRSRYEGYFDE